MKSTVPPATIKHAGKKGVAIRLPLAPVPASRPRVTRWGTYYTKTYTRWAKDAEASLTPHPPLTVNREAMFYVTIEVVCALFKTVVRPCPKGDVDNYAKAALDALTKWQGVWNDDNQVTTLYVNKRFVKDDEAPHTLILIAEK